MTEWELKFHPDFLKDLDKLSKTDVMIFNKKKEKIKENPVRLKHLSGGENCYREPITKNIRLVYFIEGNVIWLLTIGKHKEAYLEHIKRIYSLRSRLK